MDFTFDELTESVIEGARAFAQGRVAAGAGSAPVAEAIWRELGELGLLGVCVPEEHGGAGLDAVALYGCVEELARVDASVAWGVAIAAQVCAESAQDGWLDGSELVGSPPASARVLGLRGLAVEDPGPTASPAGTVVRRLCASAALVGLGRAAVDAALAYAAERQQFGRPIARFQAIQFKLADARTAVDAARLLGYRAARSGADADAAAAASYACRVLPEVCSEALQIHGGYGYTADFPVERLLRDATEIATRVDSSARLREAIAS